MTYFFPQIFGRSLIPSSVRNLATSCTVRIESLGSQGSGILIGIDRVITAYHVVFPSCPDQLTVYVKGNQGREVAFKVYQFLLGDQEKDFVVLHLAPQLSVGGSVYPGQITSFPCHFNLGRYEGPFLLSYRQGQEVKLKESTGNPCGVGSFCSNVDTVLGSSGGGCFQPDGAFFAIHIKKSTGLCGNSIFERRALYFSEIACQLVALFRSVRVCQPICPPTGRVFCASSPMQLDSCFDLEGSKAIHFRRQIKDLIFSFWEWKGGNSGPGSRGLTVAVPGGGKITYRFNENPHDVPKYNKKQNELYEGAAGAFLGIYMQKEQTPVQFSFQAYKTDFTADRWN